MLNTDIKKQINTARDILVGKIPDPKGQIDQITNALIYKFMDDQDRLAETLPGGKASFFVNGLAPYAWHKLFDSKLSNQDRANLYVEGIEKLSKAKHLPDLFQDIFKDAFLPFRASDTITMFLNEINKFDYHHSEDLGNAFEYLLSIMGSQGDAGQFRTPRNIIEFIVDAVDPQKDETILDPACGTAGFLVEAYKHITEKENLSQCDIQKLGNNITGIDIDPGMAKIARVNLYLHGFKTPQISEDDSLSNENTWGKKYDVILANPPFMTPKGGIKPHDKFTIQSKRAEVLFTDYIAEHLKLAGRAGIVVPEGIIFQGSNAYKQLRKMLVDDGYLWGVISLPSGVFNPYSGVKTSILLLDRQRASEADEIMFYKVDNDGFDLGAQRREIKGSDLPEALEVINAWRDGKKLEKEKTLFVSKEKLAEDGDYNLTGDRYREVVDYSNVKWEMVALGDLLEEKTQRVKEKDIQVWSVSNTQGFVNTEDYFEKQVASANTSNYKIINPNYFAYNPSRINVGSIAFNESEKIGCVSPMYVVFEIADRKLNSEYLFKVLKSKEVDNEINLKSQGAVRKQLRYKDLIAIKIPLPPLEVQEQIVAELDGYQAIIDGAQKVVDNWKPKIDVDPDWEKVELAKLTTCFCDGDWVESKDQSDEGIRLIQTGNIGLAKFKNKDKSKARFVTEEKFRELNYSEVFDGDVLISRLPDPVGRSCIIPEMGTKMITSVDCTICRFDFKKMLPRYFVGYTLTQVYQNQIESFCTGSSRKRISRSNLGKVLVPVPSIEVQNKIVKRITGEEELVRSTKQLIKIHEDKIKKVVDGLWGEPTK